MTMLALAGVIFLGGVTGSSHAGLFGKDETPGERFRKAMEKIRLSCEGRKLAPGEMCGEVAKLQPADPLATEEGRFAHSITIPDPVPADSGYKPGMTPEQYFEHLCKTEAGEFIYKTVENVEGVYQMRPRPAVTKESNHLYALEDPYGGPEGSNEPEYTFVGPRRYEFFESPDLTRVEPAWKRQYYHQSYFENPTLGSKLTKYVGYDGRDLRTMHKEYGQVRRSRYGYTWRGIMRPHDRELGVGGAELIVLDLQSNEVLGVHRGFARFEVDERFGVSGFQWGKACPHHPSPMEGDRFTFLLSVLKPAIFSTNEGSSHVTK